MRFAVIAEIAFEFSGEMSGRSNWAGGGLGALRVPTRCQYYLSSKEHLARSEAFSNRPLRAELRYERITGADRDSAIWVDTIDYSRIAA
jgi:hypothetical protein